MSEERKDKEGNMLKLFLTKFENKKVDTKETWFGDKEEKIKKDNFYCLKINYSLPMVMMHGQWILPRLLLQLDMAIH